jgi:hypothetical protein
VSRCAQIKRKLGVPLFNLDATVRQLYTRVSGYQGGKAVPPPAKDQPKYVRLCVGARLHG